MIPADERESDRGSLGEKGGEGGGRLRSWPQTSPLSSARTAIRVRGSVTELSGRSVGKSRWIPPRARTAAGPADVGEISRSPRTWLRPRRSAPGVPGRPNHSPSCRPGSWTRTSTAGGARGGGHHSPSTIAARWCPPQDILDVPAGRQVMSVFSWAPMASGTTLSWCAMPAWAAAPASRRRNTVQPTASEFGSAARPVPLPHRRVESLGE